MVVVDIHLKRNRALRGNRDTLSTTDTARGDEGRRGRVHDLREDGDQAGWRRSGAEGDSCAPQLRLSAPRTARCAPPVLCFMGYSQ